MVVLPSPNPPIIGIEYFNINNLMGQTLGWLKWPTLLGLIFSAAAFIIATYYIIQYTRGFYADRKVPKSWKFILWGVLVTAIAEIGEMLAFYEWPNSGLVEINLLLAIPHAVGGVLIGLGAYYMYKEIMS